MAPLTALVTALASNHRKWSPPWPQSLAGLHWPAENTVGLLKLLSCQPESNNVHAIPCRSTPTSSPAVGSNLPQNLIAWVVEILLLICFRTNNQTSINKMQTHQLQTRIDTHWSLHCSPLCQRPNATIESLFKSGNLRRGVPYLPSTEKLAVITSNELDLQATLARLSKYDIYQKMIRYVFNCQIIFVTSHPSLDSHIVLAKPGLAATLCQPEIEPAMQRTMLSR